MKSAPPRKQLVEQRRAGGRDHLHQRLCECRERAPRARGRARDLAERLRHRLARGAVRDPRVRALVHGGDQRLSAAGRRLLHRQARSRARGREQQLHIVQSNGGIMSTATARRLPVRTALSGPAAGVVAGAALAQGRRLRQSHHLRSRRHVVRRVGDRERQGLGRGADHDRVRPRDPHADGRDHHHRRGRRLDRLGRSRRAAAGRAGKRGLGAGTRLLRPGQHAPDADRRAGRARPHQCAAPARRRVEIARCRGRAARDRRACRQAARPRRRRRGGRDRARRGRPHGGRDPARVDRARARSAKIRRDAVRRRRRAACRRADPRDRAEMRDRAALPRHHVGARLRARGFAPRHGADREPDARRTRRGRAGSAHARGRARRRAP